MPALEPKSESKGAVADVITLRARASVPEDYARYVVPSYSRTPLVLVRGKGAEVWDDRGRRYLDFGGGIAVNSLGHASPVIQKALHEQAGQLVHCSNLYYHAPQARLAKKLVQLTGPGKIFFCNSGAEANECLYKLARKFGHDTGRYEIITALHSFHGRTLGGIAATGQDKIKKGFEPIMPGFVHVPFNDLRAVELAGNERTAAILIEGIQGEGGVTPATPEYLLGLRKLCDERGLLMLMDAVQCGMFRTGTFQSYERILEGRKLAQPFLPDAIAMAKSLGGGFPIAAAWIREPYANLFQPGSHGTTYGGTPLGCAVALAVLETIERENLAQNIRELGDYISAELRRGIIPDGTILQAVRGFGGLLGLVVNRPAAEVAERLREEGLIVVPAGQEVLRLLPPLNIRRDEVEEALVLLRKVLL